jgi:hypothetical protein
MHFTFKQLRFITISYTYNVKSCIQIVLFKTTHNITHITQLLVKFKLLHVLVCYSTLIRVDAFIFTHMHILQIMGGMWVGHVNMQ